MNRILVINPGSTSTKIAVYRDHVQELVTTIEHPTELIGQFPDIISQYPMREETILNYLREKGYSKKILQPLQEGVAWFQNVNLEPT